MTTLEIQKALKAAGFDPGPLDGKMGPQTRLAIRRYQTSRGLLIDDIAGPETQAALRSNKPPTQNAAPATTANTVDSATAAKYPQFSFLLNDPEVGPLLRQGLPADQLEFQIKQTNWYRTRTDAERNYLALAATDPKEAERRLNNYDSITKYIGMAQRYGQTVSFEAAARQVDRVVRGEVAPDALEQELRIQAKAMFPYLAQQIDAGATVADVFEPIKNAAASVLGINPIEIKLSDSKWTSLMQVPDGKGGFRMPSAAEIETKLRTDTKYGFDTSQNGRDDTANLIGAMKEGFGFSG